MTNYENLYLRTLFKLAHNKKLLIIVFDHLLRIPTFLLPNNQMYYWDNHIPNIYLKNDLCMILVNYFKPKIDIFYLCSVLFGTCNH